MTVARILQEEQRYLHLNLGRKRLNFQSSHNRAKVAEFKMRDYGKSSFRSCRRDKLEIVSAIISITQQPSSITQLLGDANLGYSQLKEYLRFMLGRPLIEKRDLIRGAERTTQVYQATEKGNRFLELYCEPFD